MAVIIAWGLLVVVVVAVGLHHINQLDRREIERSDRRWKALVESSKHPEAPQDRQGLIENRGGMRDWSRPPQNGPEIAKSEGVHRNDSTIRCP